jgi:hypothetical protein
MNEKHENNQKYSQHFSHFLWKHLFSEFKKLFIRHSSNSL